MRYYVNLDPAPGAPPTIVDVTELPSGELAVCVGDKAVPVDVVALDTTLSVRVGHRVVDLTTEGSPPELGAIASGQRSYVRVESERQRAAAAAKKGSTSGGDKIIKTPMAGRIVRVLVAPNDQVTPGQTLCVVEAMKMENEVKAKAAGTVLEVHVAEGATIEANGKLFTLG
jgi:biotin carboxyl carrier protein